MKIILCNKEQPHDENNIAGLHTDHYGNVERKKRQDQKGEEKYSEMKMAEI